TGEARRDAYSLLGGDHMAQLNSERRALGSDRLGILGVKGLQSITASADRYSEGIAKVYADNVRVVSQASASIGTLGNSATVAASALDKLAARANSLMVSDKASAPAATPPPQAAVAYQWTTGWRP